MIIRNIISVISHIFSHQPKKTLISILSLTLYALIDALSVISLIPVIEYLSKTDPEKASTFTKYINKALMYFDIQQTISVYFVVFSTIIIFKAFFHFFTKYIILNARVQYEGDLGNEILNSLMHSNGKWIEKQDTGKIANLISIETQKIGECLYYIYGLVGIVLKFLFYFSILFSFSFYLVLLIGISSAVTMLPSLLLSKKVFSISNARVTKSNKIFDSIIQIVNGLITIKSYVAENTFLKDFNEKFIDFKKTHSNMILIREVSGLIYEPIAVVQISFIILLSLNYFNLSFAEVLIVLFTLRNLLPLINQFITHKQVIVSSAPSHNQIQDIINNSKNNIENYNGKVVEEFTKAISIKGLNFSYTDTPILKSLNLDINHGQTVAFVGPSGSGKSTLIKLLMGLLSPQEGNVNVDGDNLNDLAINSWRKKIGFVSQETILIKDTITQNIALGDQNPNLDLINKCLKLAHLKEVVDNLENGLDTVLDEDGMSLSGGQKQRLSLARALYTNPDILILDEPTSALDSESEVIIQQTLESLKRKVTIVIIAHRLSTIKFCDEIFVLDEGQLIENGSFDNLVQKGGKFAELVKLQEL